MPRPMLVVLAAGLLLSAPALAQDPAGPLGSAPTEPAVNQTQPVVTTRPPTPRWHFFAAGVGVGAAATAFTLTPIIIASSYLGTLGTSLIGAALPALLPLLLLPPIVTTLAMWTFANLSEDGGFKLTPAFWAGLGVHVVTVVVAILLGAAVNQPSDMILLTLADAVLMPVATMAVMDHTQTRRAPGVQLRWEF